MTGAICVGCVGCGEVLVLRPPHGPNVERAARQAQRTGALCPDCSRRLTVTKACRLFSGIWCGINAQARCGLRELAASRRPADRKWARTVLADLARWHPTPADLSEHAPAASAA